MEQEGDALPISDGRKLRPLLAKALNNNQVLILKKISTNNKDNVTQILNELSRIENIPLSTLKLNAQILRDLDLVSSDNFPSLTALGRLVLFILRGEQHER